MGKKILYLGVIAVVITAALLFAGGCFPQEGAEGEGEAEGGFGGMWPMLIFLVLLFGLMYFVMIRPQRKRQQEQQNLMQELRRGDKVVTAGGIYGVIESVSEDSIVLKVESGTTIRVARSSVTGRRGEQKDFDPKIG